MKRSVVGCLGGLLFVLVAASTLLAARAPRYSRGAPQAAVDIVRDSLGVPHIFAANRRDLFFAQGYATAADRIFQMDWSRRRLLGRTAEVTGRKKDLVADFRTRALGLEQVSRDLYAALTAEERAAVEAYAAGVNEWLRTHALPREFDVMDFRPAPWRPWDALVVWRGMALTLTDLVDDLDDDGAAFQPAPSEGRDPLLGSNGWAVSGRRTRSGSPLLAGDPHLGLAMPGPLCRVALADSGTAATGFAIPGVPGLVMGRTRTVAWTPTAFEGDAADVFTYATDPGNAARYRTAAGWEKTRKVRPRVWWRLSGPLAIPVFWQPIEMTPVGPVLKRDGSRLLVLRWAGAARLPDEGLVTVHTLDAVTVRDLERSLARLGLPDINVIAADAGGSIAHLVGGRLPKRAEHRGPRDGADPALAWNGSIPFEEMPRTFDPAEGFVVSANGPPPPGPNYLGHGWPEAREKRIRFLLSGADSLGPDDFQRFQRDHVVPGARDDVAGRLASLGDAALSPEARGAARVLAWWDGRAEIDSVAPALYRAWQKCGDGAPGLERAVSWLHRRLGGKPESWTWGRVHAAVLRHALDDRDSTWSVRPFPRAGDRATIDVAGYADFDTTRFPPALSLHGPAARMISDLSPGGGTRGVLLAGQSGDPGSPHYRDQFEPWRQGRLVPFTAPGVRPQGVTQLERLEPARRLSPRRR